MALFHLRFPVGHNQRVDTHRTRHLKQIHKNGTLITDLHTSAKHIQLSFLITAFRKKVQIVYDKHKLTHSPAVAQEVAAL